MSTLRKRKHAKSPAARKTAPPRTGAAKKTSKKTLAHIAAVRAMCEEIRAARGTASPQTGAPKLASKRTLARIDAMGKMHEGIREAIAHADAERRWFEVGIRAAGQRLRSALLSYFRWEKWSLAVDDEGAWHVQDERGDLVPEADLLPEIRAALNHEVLTQCRSCGQGRYLGSEVAPIRAKMRSKK